MTFFYSPTNDTFSYPSKCHILTHKESWNNRICNITPENIIPQSKLIAIYIYNWLHDQSFSKLPAKAHYSLPDSSHLIITPCQMEIFDHWPNDTSRCPPHDILWCPIKLTFTLTAFSLLCHMKFFAPHQITYFDAETNCQI